MSAGRQAPGLVRRIERVVALGGLGAVAAVGAATALTVDRRRRRHGWLAETDPLGPKGCTLPEGRTP